MVSSLKMTPLLMAVFCLVTAGCTNITDQQTSESQHDQVAILKQIRKVNEDGSYSFGYEAGDGSFKIESRDVLGNIKGTFGFVDADGEIKRVSYSSSNGTGFKSTTVSPLQEQVSVVQSIPRVNRSSSTRKPNVVYATSTESSSSKSSVVQAIPRTRKTTTMSATSASTTTENPGRPIFGHYVKSTPKSRPRFVINGQQQRSPPAVEEEVNEDSQITRPSTDDKSTAYRRILFAKRPIDHNLRPITEEFEEKDDETKITTGNSLRRQLHEETTKAEPNHETTRDDHADVYGAGSLSTTRPLFTTSTTPRLIHRVANLGNERPKGLYVDQNNLGPARFEGNKFESPRVYEEETKMTPDEREPPRRILLRTPQPMTNENHEYSHQSHQDETFYVRRQPEHYLRELSAAGLLVQGSNSGQDETTYRTAVPIERLLYRQHSSQQPIYSTTTDSNVHYLTETPMSESEESPRLPLMQNYARPRSFHRAMTSYADQHDGSRTGRPLLRQVTQPLEPIDERDYPTASSVTPEYPYRPGSIALPPEPPNPIAPPLSRRDFQILLRRLLVSQYGARALSYPRTYLEDALYDQQPYPSYQPSYQTPLPRQPIPYDQASLAVQYGDRVPLRRPTLYGRSLDPIYQNQAYDDYQEGRYPKRVYRQKFYTREMNDEGDEILPPPIREALLLRMLQLAINAERPTKTSTMTSTTEPTSTIYRKTGPVRSVQIITDEEDDKDSMMKKN